MTGSTTNLAAPSMESSLGEWHPLSSQLDSTDGLLPLAEAADLLQLPRIRDSHSLRGFLNHYRVQLLEAIEMPAIKQAFDRAMANEVRELIELDRSLEERNILRPFATASQRIGRYQISRLRPLRDNRVVQRYLRAVEDGKARGWHSVVYGLTLSVYSIPPRQGLVVYARQTLRGFIEAAVGPLRIPDLLGSQLLEEVSENLQFTVEEIMAQGVITRPGGR